MATLWNDTDDTSMRNPTYNTQETSTTSLISNDQKTDKLKMYRYYWWKTGNMHSKAKWEEATLPYELATDITYDTYVEQTGKHNIRGFWEWENETVRVIEPPSEFHESCVCAIASEINEATFVMKGTNTAILSLGATTTRSHGVAKEADASTPLAKTSCE
nr:283_t:CDS:2 [Entrophospora candida]